VDSKPKTLGTSFLRGKLRAAGWAEVTSCILGVVENGGGENAAATTTTTKADKTLGNKLSLATMNS